MIVKWPDEPHPAWPGSRFWHHEAERVKVVRRREIHQRPDLAHDEGVAKADVGAGKLDIT